MAADFRQATLAEALAILKAHHSERLSPAENRDLDEAMLLANERDTWRELAQNAEASLRSEIAEKCVREGCQAVQPSLTNAARKRSQHG